MCNCASCLRLAHRSVWSVAALLNYFKAFKVEFEACWLQRWGTAFSLKANILRFQLAFHCFHVTTERAEAERSMSSMQATSNCSILLVSKCLRTAHQDSGNAHFSLVSGCITSDMVDNPRAHVHVIVWEVSVLQTHHITHSFSLTLTNRDSLKTLICSCEHFLLDLESGLGNNTKHTWSVGSTTLDCKPKPVRIRRDSH